MKEKSISLSETLKNLNKKYGDESVMIVDDDDVRAKVEYLSTGSYSLDRVFGGGLPMGRVIDIMGQPSSGKSALSMFLVAEVQRGGGKAALIDAEYAFVGEYAKKIGVDTDSLILSQPETGEMALDIVEKLVNTGELDIIVVDSTAALVPQKELDGDISDSNIALQARMMSKALRMITGVMSKSKTVVIFISQTRDNINTTFAGPKTVSSGGTALKFYSSVRLKVDRIKTLKDKDGAVVGNRLKIEAVKNKVGLPFRNCEIDLYFEKGIDVVGDLLDVATEQKIINLSGRTYSYGETKLGSSRDQAVSFLNENKEVLEEVKTVLNKS